MIGEQNLFREFFYCALPQEKSIKSISFDFNPRLVMCGRMLTHISETNQHFRPQQSLNDVENSVLRFILIGNKRGGRLGAHM